MVLWAVEEVAIYFDSADDVESERDPALVD